MARFGIVSSDEEEEEERELIVSSSASSSSRSPSPPPTNRLDKSTRDYSDDDDDTEEEDDSMRDDEEEEEEEESINQSEQQLANRSTRTSSFSSSRSRSPPSQRKRLTPQRQLVKSIEPVVPWAKTLGLQPKRVAVMQASFFQQPTSTPIISTTVGTTPAKSIEPMTAQTRANKGKGLDGDSLMSPRVDQAGSLNKGVPPNTSIPISSGFLAPSTILPLPNTSINLHADSTPLATSIAKGKEGIFVDAGLALGRSYRVGWGPKGELISLAKRVKDSPTLGKISTGTDKIQINRLRYVKDPSTAIDPIPVLQLQLSHTTIECDESSIPSATPNSSLRFHHFCSLAATSPPAASTSNLTLTPAARESQRLAIEAETQLWQLGQALFDEIDDLHLNRPGVDQDHINTRARIMELRRHDRVENWLREVVKKEVEEDLKVLASTSIPSSSAAKTTSGAERIFTLLTGHQISRACESAVTSNDLRLATLVAQASAGGAVDDEFKSDIYLQLVKWREYGVEEWVSAGVRKVYLLLCGEVSGNVVDGKLSRGETEPEIIHVMKGLDWKRAFGLHLWFGGGGNIDGVSSLERAVERYESASTGDKVVARPSPSYCVDSTTSSAPVPPSTGELPTDPLFHLLKLFTSPTHPLESALLPTNFGPSSLDYRLPWTLYLLFSRVLRRRDFEDRTLIDQDQMMDIPSDVVVEGNSVRADMVTETYANQLEAEGNWTWAIFVLLHLELTDRRVKSIKEVLSRNSGSIDADCFEFLVETLLLPECWLYSAQAVQAKYNDDPYLQYQLHLAADDQNPAHQIVVTELAPEAIMRNDLDLLRRLLDRFQDSRVEGWNEGGKVFLEYADCVEGLAAPSASISSFKPILLRLLQTVPRLVELGGHGMKLRVCIEEMQSRLINISSMVYQHSSTINSKNLQESDRIVWLQTANTTFFENSLTTALSAADS